MLKAACRMAATVLVATAPVTGQSARHVEGRYELRSPERTYSELVLLSGGRFRWRLDGERATERASGGWRRAGPAVLLTTDPPAGSLELVRESAWLSGEWTLNVEVERNGVPVEGATVLVGFEHGSPVRGVTGMDGWTLPRRERRRPAWLRLRLPALGVKGAREPIYAREANTIRFQLQPTPEGTINLRDEPLAVRGGELVMRRGGRALVYRRVGDAD